MTKQQPVAGPVNLAIFASGGGSNARAICTYFRNSEVARVAVICTNNPHSGVFGFAPEFDIPVVLLKPQDYRNGHYLSDLMRDYQVQLVVLAGWLKLLPASFIRDFPRKIVNIHPSLLPKYGGKGMYGLHVHKAVLAAGEKQSGITIHYVDEEYDRGESIFQEMINVDSSWTPEELQRKVLVLEHRFFPRVIEKLCLEMSQAPKKA